MCYTFKAFVREEGLWGIKKAMAIYTTCHVLNYRRNHLKILYQLYEREFMFFKKHSMFLYLDVLGDQTDGSKDGLNICIL